MVNHLFKNSLDIKQQINKLTINNFADYTSRLWNKFQFGNIFHKINITLNILIITWKNICNLIG